ncbi:MAG TPA: DnaB-like helicase C-terminal domain-containing protein, partial [Candidatus Binatia bacterium]
KLVKLRRKMADKAELQSEGSALEAALAELERDHAVKEISGWETGFANLNRALDGIRPGLYLLIGAPAIGKTSFARQLLDQVALQNHVAGIFFSFAETREELRIRTLARLSGLDQREIRRGSAYLLHWYGVPRLPASEPNNLPPSWDRLKRVAQEAKNWLDKIYLLECGRAITIKQIEAQIAELRMQNKSEQMMIVIDDCQRLDGVDQAWDVRLQIIAEQLQQTALKFKLPMLAVWPDLESDSAAPAQKWADKTASPDVVLVMERDSTRRQPVDELRQAIILHVVKNRGGEKGRLAYEFAPASATFTETP